MSNRSKDSSMPSEGSFISCLSRTLSAANEYLVHLLNEVGLTDLVPSHGDILMRLFTGDAPTMQELSKDINRDPSTVTALVKKLCNAGYVATRTSTIDRRRTEVFLTQKGEGLKSDFDEISKKLIQAQMKDVGRADFERTCLTLCKIRENLIEANTKEKR